MFSPSSRLDTWFFDVVRAKREVGFALDTQNRSSARIFVMLSSLSKVKGLSTSTHYLSSYRASRGHKLNLLMTME